MPDNTNTWYTFHDFVSGKIRRTSGTFSGWTGPGGPMNAFYAVFRNKMSDNLIPEYCLTKETRRRIGSPPSSD